MKLDKRLQTMVQTMAEGSFNDSGKLQEVKVQSYLQSLKKLPASRALSALQAYLKQLKREIAQKTLQIESVIPLTKPEVEKITRFMSGQTAVIQVKTKLNPSLLGGIRLKMGDVVYDDSVSRKIKTLKEKSYA